MVVRDPSHHAPKKWVDFVAIQQPITCVEMFIGDKSCGTHRAFCYFKRVLRSDLLIDASIALDFSNQKLSLSILFEPSKLSTTTLH